MHSDNDSLDDASPAPASPGDPPPPRDPAPAPVRIPIHISRDPNEPIASPPRKGPGGELEPEAEDGSDFVETSYRRLRDGVTRIGKLMWREVHQALAELEDRSKRQLSRKQLPALLHGFLTKLEWDLEAAGVRDRADGARVDVTFRFDFQELFALPWELTPVGADGPSLGDLERCLISYEKPGRRTEPRRPDEPGGRILVITADSVRDPLPIQEHLAALAEACEAGGIPFDPRTDVVRDATLAKVQERLAEMPARPTILHVLCHGTALEGGREPGIELRSDAGSPEAVKPLDFASALGEHAGNVRLVVLCVCHSAATGAASGPLGSLAMEIHQQGIEAVIASRFLISKDGTIRFTQAFYRALLGDLRSVQDAFLMARAEMKKHVDTRTLDDLALQLFAREEDGPDLRPIVFRPYRGLLAFETEHQRFYFGRRAEIAEAVSEIGALGADAATPQIFFVTGASGRGKSSIVTAGIVPLLPPPRASGPGEPERRWHVEKTRPSAGLEELENALARAAGKDTVLIVDQFEEIVTSMPRARALLYFERLWRLATDRARRTLVLGALRVDFIARMGELSIPGGTGTLEDVLCKDAHHVLLGPMKEDALRAAILGPARLVGLSFDDGLPADIVRDAGNEPGVLPLVAYVLDQLWHRRRGSRLTREAYEKMGRLQGALCGHAAKVYKALGKEGAKDGRGAGEARQAAARRILVALVESNDLSPLTRRIVPKWELLAMPGLEAEASSSVLQTLEEARLVVVRTGDGGPQGRDGLCEIAHEMLIRDWQDLRGWVGDHRAKNRDLHHFEKLGASSDGIVRDEEYARLGSLVERPEVPIPPGVQRLWERSRRFKRRRELRIAATAVGIVLWAALATYSWLEVTGERDDAKAEANDARKQALIAGAHGFVARGEHVWASKLLLAVPETDPAPGFVEAANEVLARKLPLRTFPGTMPQVSPDGERLFTVEPWAGRVLVHRTDGKGKPWSLPGTLPGIESLAVSPDGTHVVGAATGTAQAPGGLHVWQVRPDAGAMRVVQAGDPPGRVTDASAPVWSAGGQSFAAIIDGAPHVFSADGQQVRAVVDGTQPAFAVALSPDGRTLLVGRTGEDGRRAGAAEVWSLAPGPTCQSGPPCLVATLEQQAFALGFSPDGWRVYVAHAVPGVGFPVVSVWSVDQWSGSRQVHPLRNTGASPGGGAAITWIDGRRWLVATGEQAMIVEEGSEVRRLPGGWLARVSRDGERMVSASLTTAFVDHQAAGTPRVELSGQSSLVSDVAFDPQGRFVITASDTDGTSRLFPLDGEGGVLFNARPDSSVGLPDGVILGAHKKLALLHFQADETSEAAGYLVHLTPPYTSERLPPGGAELSQDEKHLLLVTRDATTVLPAEDRKSARPAFREPCSVIDAVFSRDAQHVIELCADGVLRRAAVSGEGPTELLATFEGCAPEPQVSLSRFGESALVRCAAGDLWAFRPGAPPFELVDLCGPESSWTLAPDGQRVACTDLESMVAIIPLEAPDAPRYLVTGEHRPLDFWFSRSGSDLAVATSNNEVHVLRPDPRVDVELPKHPQRVLSVMLDRAGEVAVTVSTDGWMRVFHLSDLNAPPDMLRTGRLAFDVPAMGLSEDGSTALVVSGVGTARLLHLSRESLRADLAKANADCLPVDLRRSFLGESAADAASAHRACEERAGR